MFCLVHTVPMVLLAKEIFSNRKNEFHVTQVSSGEENSVNAKERKGRNQLTIDQQKE